MRKISAIILSVVFFSQTAFAGIGNQDIRLKTPSGGIVASASSAGILERRTAGDFALFDGKTIVTETSVTPSSTKFIVPAGANAIRIWHDEPAAMTESSFDLYIRRNGGTVYKVKTMPFTARILRVNQFDSVALGTSDGRSLFVSAMAYPVALSTPSGVTGTANADHAGPPLWLPSAAHVTLPAKNKPFILESDGTERIIFISEYTGSAWTPVRFVRLLASTDTTVQASYSQVALASYEGTSIGVTCDTGCTVGGTSTTMSFDQVATGTTYNVATSAEFFTAAGSAVAGDEIVFTTNVTLASNVTDATFTANELAGRQGAEGIIIRGNTGVPADITITPANSTSGWYLTQVGATQYTLIKGLTFNIAGIAAYVRNIGGKFRWQDCRITGNSTSTTAPNFEMNSASGALTLDALRVQGDDGVEDIFDGNGTGSDSGTTSVIRLIDCLGFDAGTTNDNQQIITTHSGQRLQVWGGEFYDARLNVVANDSNATSIVHMFFTKTHDGAAARRGGMSDFSAYFCWNDSSNTDTYIPELGTYSIGTHVTRDGHGAANSVVRFSASLVTTVFDANWVVTNNGRALFPSAGGGTYRWNVLTSTSGEAIRIQNYDGSSANQMSYFYNNTISSSATAWAYGHVDLPSTLRNNASAGSTNSVTGVTAGEIANEISSTHGHYDPTVDPDFPAGSNDVVTGDGAFSSTTFMPTDAGNLDLAGTGAIYDSVGWIDFQGYVAIYKYQTTSKGARNLAEIIADAQVLPDYY